MIDEGGREPRSFAGLEPQILADRMRDDEDVGKQDRAVESEAGDRLQRHLGRRRAVMDELQEAALVGPECTIFGEIASRLAHQPNRRGIATLPVQHREQGSFNAQFGPRELAPYLSL
jgi:hypothetical protein